MLIALGGLVGAALWYPVLDASVGPRREAAARLETAALWCAAGLAILTAGAAVVAGAQTLNLEYIVLAQRHTSLFMLTQPAAASIYVVSLALAAQAGVPERHGSAVRRGVQLAALAAWSALGATLFLGGSAGQVLPGPLWLLLKSLLVAALVLAARRWLRQLSSAARLAVAWIGCLLGFLNLAISLLWAPR